MSEAEERTPAPTTPTTPDAPAATEPEKWLDLHGDVLYRVALGRTRNPLLAQDLVQETLLAAFRSYGTGTRPDNDRAWLLGILRNKLVDHYRRRSRETPFSDLQSLEQEQLEAFTSGKLRGGQWIADFGPKEWPAPDDSLNAVDFWRAFDRCVSRLPPRIAQAFLLREMDGLSAEEICKDFGISPNNLWVMLHRARMVLRRCLEMNWFDDKPKK